MNLDEKIKEYRKQKTRADKANASMEALRAEITAEMDARHTDTVYSPFGKVTWKDVSSTRLNSKALKAAHPALYASFCTKSSFKRFVLA